MSWWYAVVRVGLGRAVLTRHGQSFVLNQYPNANNYVKGNNALISYALPYPSSMAVNFLPQHVHQHAAQSPRSTYSDSQTAFLAGSTRFQQTDAILRFTRAPTLRRLIRFAPRLPSSDDAKREVHTQPQQDSKSPRSRVSDAPPSRSMVGFVYTHSSGRATFTASNGYIRPWNKLPGARMRERSIPTAGGGGRTSKVSTSEANA